MNCMSNLDALLRGTRECSTSPTVSLENEESVKSAHALPEHKYNLKSNSLRYGLKGRKYKWCVSLFYYLYWTLV